MRSITTIIVLLISFQSFTQQLPKKPLLSEIRAYNQNNILKLSLGMSRDSVVLNMGGIKNIQSWQCHWSGCHWGRVKAEIINNPYSRDLKSDKEGNPIEILWYYTDVKSRDGSVRKDELTPVIIEKMKLAGIGWGFYEDYSKRKELNINIQ